MNHQEEFEIKRDVHRKWLEQFNSNECIKLLSDVYEAIEYKQQNEQMLGRICAN